MMARGKYRFVLCGALLVPAALVYAQAGQQTGLMASSDGGVKPASLADLPDIPPAPTGKSTIMGGAIRDVDPVRDRFTLHVYGIKPLKILFDSRTQFYKDGKRIPLHDFGPASHASVQTTLDQGQVFALTVHILSQLPEGDFQGQVVSYNPESGELVLSAAQGGQPFRLRVTTDTSFEREGQSSFASGQSGATDLVPGSLVTVQFDAGAGKGIARQIKVLATPGSTFVFAGNITALNLAAGELELVDPRYNMSYQITFDTHSGNASQLRVGQHVRVSADYDGHKYVATEVTPE